MFFAQILEQELALYDVRIQGIIKSAQKMAGESHVDSRKIIDEIQTFHQRLLLIKYHFRFLVLF